jgi:hypothetical protein
MNHETLQELLAVDALGGLDAEGLAELEVVRRDHGPCEECAMFGSELREVAGLLGFALDPVAGPDDPAQIISQRERPDRVVDLRRRGARWVRATLAAAAVVAVFFAGWAFRGPGGTPVPRLVSFKGSGGTLAAAFVPGRPGVTLSGSGFASLPSDQTYELWTFHGKTPTPGGCFTPSDGSISTTVPANATGANLMAVTVESSACPSAPTTTPILTVTLR